MALNVGYTQKPPWQRIGPRRARNSLGETATANTHFPIFRTAFIENRSLRLIHTLAAKRLGKPFDAALGCALRIEHGVFDMRRILPPPGIVLLNSPRGGFISTG
jgi:hypothetical protein